MNLCIFMGRLTRDPESRYSEDKQKLISRFTIAVDRPFKREGDPSADFINCVAFDRKAEFAEQYVTSGMKVAVQGKLRTDNYTNKQGEKVYGFCLYADNIEFADGKKGSGQEKQESPAQNAQAAQPAAQGNGAKQPARTAARGSGSAGARPAAQAQTGARPAAQAQAGTRPAAQGQAGTRPAAQARTAQPSAASQPAANPAPQRTPAGRTAPARNTAQRPVVSRNAGYNFNNVPVGVEDGGLPFN